MDAVEIKRLLVGDDRDPRAVIEEVFAVADAAGTAYSRALAWASVQLAAEGVSSEDEVSAIRVIREAEPALGLKTSRYLAHQLSVRG